jgi:hypothetical protein
VRQVGGGHDALEEATAVWLVEATWPEDELDEPDDVFDAELDELEEPDDELVPETAAVVALSCWATV